MILFVIRLNFQYLDKIYTDLYIIDVYNPDESNKHKKLLHEMSFSHGGSVIHESKNKRVMVIVKKVIKEKF